MVSIMHTMHTQFKLPLLAHVWRYEIKRRKWKPGSHCFKYSTLNWQWLWSYIMAYGSTPYVGMTPQKMAATIKVYKWHAQNVTVRLVNGLHEPYQAVLSTSMGNRTVNFGGKHCWSTRPASLQNGQIVYLLTFFLSFLHHDSMITAEAIQTQKNSINHWVLCSPLIVLKKRIRTSWRFSGNPTLMLAALRYFVWI